MLRKYKLNKPQQTKKLIKDYYLADSRPLVVTFSGGKDSTTVLQELKKEY